MKIKEQYEIYLEQYSSKFHITEGKEWEDGMHPDDLYRMIGSSKEIALAKSEKLSRKH